MSIALIPNFLVSKFFIFRPVPIQSKLANGDNRTMVKLVD